MSAIRHLSPVCQGFVGERRTDNGCDNLVQVGQPLHGIGEGLLVDLGVVGPDAVADGAVGYGGKFEDSWQSPFSCYQSVFDTFSI